MNYLQSVVVHKPGVYMDLYFLLGKKKMTEKNDDFQ